MLGLSGGISVPVMAGVGVGVAAGFVGEAGWVGDVVGVGVGLRGAVQAETSAAQVRLRKVRRENLWESGIGLSHVERTPCARTQRYFREPCALSGARRHRARSAQWHQGV